MDGKYFLDGDLITHFWQFSLRRDGRIHVEIKFRFVEKEINFRFVFVTMKSFRL